MELSQNHENSNFFFSESNTSFHHISRSFNHIKYSVHPYKTTERKLHTVLIWEISITAAHHNQKFSELFLHADADIWLTREANRVTGEQERTCTEKYWEAQSLFWLANLLYQQGVIQRNDRVGSSSGLEQTLFCIHLKCCASVTVVVNQYIVIPSSSPNWTFSFHYFMMRIFKHRGAEITIPYP